MLIFFAMVLGYIIYCSALFVAVTLMVHTSNNILVLHQMRTISQQGKILDICDNTLEKDPLRATGRF